MNEIYTNRLKKFITLTYLIKAIHNLLLISSYFTIKTINFIIEGLIAFFHNDIIIVGCLVSMIHSDYIFSILSVGLSIFLLSLLYHNSKIKFIQWVDLLLCVLSIFKFRYSFYYVFYFIFFISSYISISVIWMN